MGRAEQLPRALSKFVDLGLHCKTGVAVCDCFNIHCALIGQVVKHVVRCQCFWAALLEPAQHTLNQSINWSIEQAVSHFQQVGGDFREACGLFCAIGITD